MKKSLYLFIGFSILVTISYSQSTQTHVGKPIVILPCYFDVSPPLRDMYQDPNAKADMSWKDGVVRNMNPKNVVQDHNPNAIYSDPNVQYLFGTLNPDTTDQNFDGLAGDGSLCPPDPAGDIGPDHYVQMVNCKYAVYDKSGVKLLGPFNSSQIWNGMPNNSNDGDGIVLYDEEADRWLISQFSLPNPNGPFYEMVAISVTADPTGSWNRYQYSFSELPDYPKLGVWGDAYLLCVNRFNGSGSTYYGPGAAALNRDEMLAGIPTAPMVFFPVNNANYYHGLPVDCDGAFPPAGTPGYFAWSSSSKINLYEFHVDWTTPSNSTFTPSQQIDVIPFSSIPWAVGLPQKGTSVKLAALSNNYSLMNRLQLRYFSDHLSMVTNGTIDVGSSRAGIRWYEFRKTGSAPWAIYQQATYAPDDGNSRWNGSIAMDSAGNIALAYNITSSNMYPSIRYTGRMACDPLNQFTINESGIINGGGSQTNTWSGNPSRWGDYSALTVDPSNAGTFWFTNEYYSSMSQANWKTRIASFSFADVLCVTATATPSAICSGQSSQLNAAASGGTGSYTYSWTSVPAGYTSSQQNPSVSPTVSTQYVCEVDDGTASKTDTASVTVFSQPTADAGPDATYPNTTPLFPVSGTATSYSSVKWLTSGDGHFNIDTVPASLYYPGSLDKSNGGVDLTFKAYPIGSCSDTASDGVHITLTFPTGVGDNSSAAFGVAISPNPSGGIFSLVIHGIRNAEARITISDFTGKELFNDNVISSSNSLTKEINMAGYPKGIYFVKVRTDQQATTKKIVLQ